MGITRLQDGSLIVPEKDAPRQLASLLRSKGASAKDIANAIETWRHSPAGRQIALGDETFVKKWDQHPSLPTYAERPLSPLVPLKSAYEFCALLIGGSIYKREFEFLRRVLREQNSKSAHELVSQEVARSCDAFHGIAFQGNNEVAQFQVRLFGSLAYTVTFPRLIIDCEKYVYTHRLDTGDEPTGTIS